MILTLPPPISPPHQGKGRQGVDSGQIMMNACAVASGENVFSLAADLDEQGMGFGDDGAIIQFGA